MHRSKSRTWAAGGKRFMDRGNKKISRRIQQRWDLKEVENSGKSAGLDMFVMFPG